MVVRMERENRTDAELLRHSRRDPDAFILVCRRHAAALDGWLTVQVRDAGLARELLAETFSEAWFSRGRFADPGDGDARPWLFGIARNLVRRVYRDRAVASRGRARLGLPVAAPDEYGEVIDRLAAGQTLGSLDEHLAALPESPARRARAAGRLRARLRGDRPAARDHPRGSAHPCLPRARDVAGTDRKEYLTMSATHDVESLLRDLATAVHRDHRRRRRQRLLGGLAVVAVVCTTGVALAGSYADWWTGAEPPVNPSQVDRVIEENTIGLLTPDGNRKATVARTPNAVLVADRNQGRRLLPDPLPHRPAEHRQLVHQRAGERATHVRVSTGDPRHASVDLVRPRDRRRRGVSRPPRRRPGARRFRSRAAGSSSSSCPRRSGRRSTTATAQPRSWTHPVAFCVPDAPGSDLPQAATAPATGGACSATPPTRATRACRRRS